MNPRSLLILALAAACLPALAAAPSPRPGGAIPSASPVPGRVLAWSARQADPVPVEEAFKVQVELGERGRLEVAFLPHGPGYHLYRDSLEATSGEVALARQPLPRGRVVEDPYLGRQEIFDGPVAWQIQVPERAGAFTLEVGFQGCLENRLCYPPTHRSFLVDPATPGLVRAVPAHGRQGAPDVAGMHGSSQAPGPTRADPANGWRGGGLQAFFRAALVQAGMAVLAAGMLLGWHLARRGRGRRTGAAGNDSREG